MMPRACHQVFTHINAHSPGSYTAFLSIVQLYTERIQVPTLPHAPHPDTFAHVRQVSEIAVDLGLRLMTHEQLGCGEECAVVACRIC